MIPQETDGNGFTQVRSKEIALNYISLPSAWDHARHPGEVG